MLKSKPRGDRKTILEVDPHVTTVLEIWETSSGESDLISICHVHGLSLEIEKSKDVTRKLDRGPGVDKLTTQDVDVEVNDPVNKTDREETVTESLRRPPPFARRRLQLPLRGITDKVTLLNVLFNRNYPITRRIVCV